MELRPFDLAWIVSDLHIGGVPGSQMFQCGPQFKSLIDQILKEHQALRKSAGGKRDAQCLLVINGDFIDFLAQMPKGFFSLNDSLSMLKSIMQEPAFQPVTKALQNFAAADGTHLVVVLGNHDLELTLPDCRQHFIDTVTDGKPERRGKVELCFEGWGYRFSVGGRKALCMHGNETDPWNFTRYDELDRIQREMTIHGGSEFGHNWMPSAGTQFVIKAVNPIKAEFPFVDLMHPFSLLIAVLGILDPSNITYGNDAAKAAARAALNETTRPQSQRRMLSAGAMATGGAAVSRHLSTDEIVKATEEAMRDGTIDQLIASDGSELLFMDGWIDSMKSTATNLWNRTVELKDRAVKSLTDTGRAIHCEALRRTLMPMVQEIPETPIDLSKADKAIESAIGGTYDVVFAGHTHSLRFAPRISGKGFYVNTGTWADRMTILRKDLNDSQKFRELYDAMIGGPDDSPEKARQRLRETHLGDRPLVELQCPAACLRPDKSGKAVVQLWQPKASGGKQIEFEPKHQQNL